MLTAEDLRVVLSSAPLRQQHGLELPQPSLTTLAGDPGAFANFYEQWTAQGQPRYVPPSATPAATPAPEPAPAPAPVQDAGPHPAPVQEAAPHPAPLQEAAPVVPAVPPVPVPPRPFGPPPTPRAAQPFLSYSRDPAAAAPFAGGSAPSPNAANPYAANPFAATPYSGANYLNSPNTVAPAGLARPGMTMMLWGFGVAIVGVIITGVTWSLAAPGGTFVVAWGAIIFGTIRGIIGLVRLNRG